MSDSIWKRLVDAFQDQADEEWERRRNYMPSTQRVTLDEPNKPKEDGWRVECDRSLPDGYVKVSKDIWESLMRGYEHQERLKDMWAMQRPWPPPGEKREEE